MGVHKLMGISTEKYFNGYAWIFKQSFWTMDSVRELCIKHKYYTCGDNKDYGKMLRYVGNNEPTIKSIYIIAKDIYLHSTIKDEIINEQCGIAMVMRILQNEAVTTVFSIFSEED